MGLLYGKIRMGVNSQDGFFNGFIQFLLNNRFEQVITCAEFDGGSGIFKIIIAADYNILGVWKFGGSLFQKFRAVHHRHLHIHKTDVRTEFPHSGKRFFAVCGRFRRHDMVSVPASESQDGDLYRFFIVNDQCFIHGAPLLQRAGLM